MREPVPFGSYLLLDRIAVGGMAEVFLAIRPGEADTRLYALKRILPTLSEDEELLAMFLDEARLGVHLDHPALQPVHELGRHGDAWFIALEYVAGRDLGAALRRAREGGRPLPVPLAAWIAHEVARALDHAHRRRDADGRPLGIVHRDVAPSNVLLGFDGSVRLIDFGIAQAGHRSRRDDAVLRGKLAYLSPEVARGAPADRRADVFALGIVLHEMLTGERLFRARSELATLDRIASADVRPPSERNPAVPAGLDAIVLRALSRDPAGRQPWASDVARELAPYAEESPPGGAPALARYLARLFPAELRAELERLERLAGGPTRGPR
jgi:serine/threonine-protein kinase